MPNIGANADFTSVSPVFPSLPAYGTPWDRASSSIAGQTQDLEAVKLMNAARLLRAAYA
jgi:hypothetical protein